jgi:hypothetical protein
VGHNETYASRHVGYLGDGRAEIEIQIKGHCESLDGVCHFARILCL